jgi:hypothetical protein
MPRYGNGVLADLLNQQFGNARWYRESMLFRPSWMKGLFYFILGGFFDGKINSDSI